jgi:ABC-2 type transport system ATP-binding protein
MADDLTIDVRGLVKRFGAVRALDELDLQVARGEVHGFLGPNGSGKSTTIRILLGLLRSDAGSVRLLGGDPWRDAVALHHRLAYVPGEVALWPNLSGGEAIDLLGRMRGGFDRTRRDELVERFQLDPARRFDTYSKGNRQKVALVAALAAEVDLYLFDEPTSGLDPLMLGEFERCVRERVAAGATVLLSSHVLGEVEALCERVTIIRDGRTIESGSLEQLRHVTRTTITARTERPVRGIEQLAGVHDARVDDLDVQVQVDAGAVGPVLRLLADHGVESLTSAPPSLEELFARYYEQAQGRTGTRA